MNTLFLRLEAPLQAWGLRANWEERDSADAPTKSGVIGLLGCARGYYRDDKRLRVLSDGLLMGVRVDLPGIRLSDYHTTGGAKARDGKPEGVLGTGGKRKPETDLSRRQYLADASFLVALHGEPAIVARCADALQAPVWPVFLGRKSCVPAAPVFAGVGQHDDLEAALAAQPLHPRGDAAPRLLIETGPGHGHRQNDNIGNPVRRVFHPRYVAERPWPADTATINTLEG